MLVCHMDQDNVQKNDRISESRPHATRTRRAKPAMPRETGAVSTYTAVVFRLTSRHGARCSTLCDIDRDSVQKNCRISESRPHATRTRRAKPAMPRETGAVSNYAAVVVRLTSRHGARCSTLCDIDLDNVQENCRISESCTTRIRRARPPLFCETGAVSNYAAVVVRLTSTQANGIRCAVLHAVILTGTAFRKTAEYLKAVQPNTTSKTALVL